MSEEQPELRKTVVRTVKIRAYHRGCGGELVGTGTGITTIETGWQHRCRQCNAEIWLDGVSYPTIAYEETKA